MSRFAPILAVVLFASPATAAAPTCALLDPSKTPQGAILEAKLLGDPAATWVERANIDAVLKEQQLQAAFGPKGVADRVKLGQLLKADLLVLVRPVKDAKEPALELVVSETAGGLRLLVRGVPITKDSDADVAALQAAVREGIKKHGERVREVVAVPPFVSTDFEVTFDHLKGAFAKLAEAEALNRPGVVVVELEEAHAVAKELALAGDKLKRPLPVYLLGEYRHEGKGADRTLTVKLRADRGGKAVGKDGSHAGKPDAAPGAVREWSAKLVDSLLADGQARPPANPKAEAKLLAERGAVFRRLANWDEASDLVEAAILLDPDSPDLLVAAILPLNRIAQRAAIGGPTPAAIRRLRTVQALGLAHIEKLVTLDDNLKAYQDAKVTGLIIEFQYAIRAFSPYSKKAEWPTHELEELHETLRQASLKFIPIAAKAGVQAELPYITDALSHLPTRERYALAEKILADLKDIPDRRVIVNITLRTVWLWRGHYFEFGKPAEEEAAYRAMLARLEAGTDETYAAAAKLARLALDEEMKNALKAPAAAGTGIRFSALHLVRTDGYPVEPLHGVLAISPKLDVAWNKNGLFLMREKGRLEHVWVTNEDSFRFRSVIFDGRYVWAATMHHGGWPFLLVLDPATGKVKRIDDTDGVPIGTAKQLEKTWRRHIEIAAIAPGRVCAAGSFSRAWIADITHDPTGKPAVKVVHEARENPEQLDVNQGLKTTIDFVPSYMFTVTEGKAIRVVIGRNTSAREERGSNRSVEKRPLVYDPAAGSVTALGEEYLDRGLTFPHRGIVVRDGRAYTVVLNGNNTPGARVDLLRLDLPGLKPTVVANTGARPALFSYLDTAVLHEGRLFFIWNWVEPVKPNPLPLPMGTSVTTIHDLWSINLDGTAAKLVAEKLPQIQNLHVSAHYGLLADFFSGNRAEMHLATIGAAIAPPRSTKLGEEAGAKSAASREEGRFTIVNSSGKPIRLFWMDTDGNRRLYREIATGGRHDQLSYSGHVWLVTDADDNAWRLLRPEAKPQQTFEITGPDKK